MSFGLVVYDKDGKVSLDASSFTVRLVTQRRINLGWMGYNQVSSVAVPEAKAGMFAILTPMHSYDGINSLQSSLETGWVNPHAPVSTPYVQVYNGYVEIRAHGVSPNGYLEDYYYMNWENTREWKYVIEREYVNDRKYVNRREYKNFPEYRRVCEWKRVWKWDSYLGRDAYVNEYVCENKLVDNWKWVDNWVWEDDWGWVDTSSWRWVEEWRDVERLHQKTGTTSRTSGNVMLYLFTNH